jgi:predicted transcriptional regulator
MQKKPLKESKPQKHNLLPTAAELRLLQVLWEIGNGTVEDVVDAHSPKERPNYKTTQTFLRIMEQKGLITHEARGRVFVFTPLVSRKTIDHLSVKALLSRNFRGSAAGLLINLLEASPIKKKDLDELEAYLQEYRKKQELGSRRRD